MTRANIFFLSSPIFRFFYTFKLPVLICHFNCLPTTTTYSRLWICIVKSNFINWFTTQCCSTCCNQICTHALQYKMSKFQINKKKCMTSIEFTYLKEFFHWKLLTFFFCEKWKGNVKYQNRQCVYSILGGKAHVSIHVSKEVFPPHYE